MNERTTRTGEVVYVAHTETERGSKGPFLVVYADREKRRRWGYFCTNCESVDTAMDTMGRIKCSRCANVKKPDEWDAAHE